MGRMGLNKSGQITIFVILAIFLVVAVSSYFVFKGTIFPSKVSSTFEPVETQFLDCLGKKTSSGIRILETYGGYIELPEFVPGSGYMPFSSELNFAGVSLPYWNYISGNNLEKTQVPTKKDLQNQLESYLEEEVQGCKFKSLRQEGYQISGGTPKVEVFIGDDYVRVFLNMDLAVSKGDESVLIKEHEVEIDSRLGSLYDGAVKFYELERKEMFLENYSVDFLRLYAPVDGVELTCAPKVWNADEIFKELKEANEVNFLALKNSGSKDDYFNLNLPIDSEIRIVNSKNWPSTYEVEPADSPILVSEPIGNQEGLGILGFCYVPYHFVYNLRYPVLIQLIQEEETFQFPLAIIIEGNVPRESRSGRSVEDSGLDLCGDKITPVNVNLLDSNLNSLDANVSYECFGSRCQIGQTSNGELKGLFPQCVNGKVIVNKEGYRRSSTTFSSVNEGSVSIILNKEYEEEISLILGNKSSQERAIISFVSDGDSKTIVYPETKRVKLSEGNYNLKVYIYENSSLKFPETTKEQCIEVPVSGIGGIFGFKKTECSEVVIPEQTIPNVLVGGGKGEAYFSEGDLKSGKKLEIKGERLKTPSSLDELQISYLLFETRNVEVSFK